MLELTLELEELALVVVLDVVPTLDELRVVVVEEVEVVVLILLVVLVVRLELVVLLVVLVLELVDEVVLLVIDDNVVRLVVVEVDVGVLGVVFTVVVLVGVLGVVEAMVDDFRLDVLDFVGVVVLSQGKSIDQVGQGRVKAVSPVNPHIT